MLKLANYLQFTKGNFYNIWLDEKYTYAIDCVQLVVTNSRCSILITEEVRMNVIPKTLLKAYRLIHG